MHEYSLASALLKIVLAEAHKHRAAIITEVQVGVGVLTGLEAQTFTGCWELITEGTIVENAKLQLQFIAAKAKCIACGHEFELIKIASACVACGQLELSVQGGRDFTLLALQGKGEI